DGRTTMRIRALGSAPLASVLTNPVAHDTFLRRTAHTKPTNPLIDMRDQMGSYLLHLLQPWVCGMARIGAYPHDIWIMAPVCEPAPPQHLQIAPGGSAPPVGPQAVPRLAVLQANPGRARQRRRAGADPLAHGPRTGEAAGRGPSAASGREDEPVRRDDVPARPGA